MVCLFKQLRRWGLTGLCLLVLAYQGYVLTVAWHAEKTGLPDNYGNFERVRKMLPAAGADEPFSFVVVGDTRSLGTFEALERDMDAEKPAFAVILGDWVDAGREESHAWFRAESRESLHSCPVFFTPGNHDVDPRLYPLRQYESDYGPRNFSFALGDNLFIFISHLDGRFSNEDSLDFLRGLERQDIGRYRRRFVFMHIPPWISPDIKERHTADEAELVRVLREMRADYVVAADFHGYNRTSRDGVEYIITGGGGAKLDTVTGRQFHHALELTVGTDFVSERILLAQPRFDPLDWLEMHAVVHVAPFMARFPAWFAAGDVLLLFVLVRFARRAGGKRS